VRNVIWLHIRDTKVERSEFKQAPYVQYLEQVTIYLARTSHQKFSLPTLILPLQEEYHIIMIIKSYLQMELIIVIEPYGKS